MPEYIVAAAEMRVDELEEGDIVRIFASSEQEALEQAIEQHFAPNDNRLREYVLDRSADGLSAHFAVQTPEEKALLEKEGKVRIADDLIIARVRADFPEHTDFAEAFLAYYFSDANTMEVPKDVLIYLWKTLPRWGLLVVIPLQQIPLYSELGDAWSFRL